MTNIIEFPKVSERRAAEVEVNILQSMEHPNPKTLARWRELSAPYIRKYLRRPERTQPGLALPIPGAMTAEEQEAIADAIRTYVRAYDDDVEKHIMKMLGDIILLLKSVAESET